MTLFRIFYYISAIVLQLASCSLNVPAEEKKGQYINGEVGLDGVLIDTQAPAPATTSTKDKYDENNDGQCKLYLAKSSIPNAGIGLYSGISVKQGGTIGTPDICIQLIDMKRDTVAEEYVWAANDVGAEFDAVDVDSLCAGLGMAVNSHAGLNNMENGAPMYDSGGLHRSTHPGAGAFTYYHEYRTEATEDVPAGSELFMNYGEVWFESREEELGTVLSTADFALADHVNVALELFMDQYGYKSTEDENKHVLELVRNILDVDILKKALGILPEKMHEVRKAVEDGSARYSIPESIRSIDWLETNGYCVDNIEAGPSTKPAAGRGAFATRHMKKGSVVSASPLLRFHRGDLLMKLNDGTESRQLLLNYCFGHPQSTLLFYPYGPVVNLINHDSKAPNAEVRWSQKNKDGEVLLESSFLDLGEDKDTVLIIEYVAKRDIEPGEEIYMDYGKEWQDAWKEHVEHWKPEKKSKEYVTASAFNDLMADKPLRTMEEQGEMPYPDNLITACFFEYVPSEEEEEEEGFSDDADEDVVLSIEEEWEETEQLFECHHYLRPCDILSRQEKEEEKEEEEEEPSENKTETFYTVEVFNTPGSSEDKDFLIPDTVRHIVTNIPRRAIIFVELPYMGDQHLTGAFRHAIGFPDEIYPPSWKNA